ncbi:hypothetical protein ES703_39521 [subsurface metagenome]
MGLRSCVFTIILYNRYNRNVKGFLRSRGGTFRKDFYLLGGVWATKLTNNRSGDGFFIEQLLRIYKPLLGKTAKGGIKL